MSEQPIKQTPIDATAELETLRRTNSELTEKSKTRKARIAELETANTALQAQVNTLTVDVPLRHMAEKLSTNPDLFLEQLSKNYKVKLIDNKLTLHSVEDDKPVSIPFEREELLKMLADPKHPNADFYSKYLIVSRASGGGISNKQHSGSRASSKPAIKFGLR